MFGALCDLCVESGSVSLNRRVAQVRQQTRGAMRPWNSERGTRNSVSDRHSHRPDPSSSLDFRYNLAGMHPRDLFLAAQLEKPEIEALLGPYRFKDPLRADEHLTAIAGLVASPERLGRWAEPLLTELSRSVDPDAAVRQLEAFFEKVPSPVHLLTSLETNPSALEILVGILGGSPFLAETLLRNPEYFYWLLEKGRLERVCDHNYFRAQAEEVTRPFSEAPQALGALRRLRRRESLRIGAQDILGVTRMQDTVAQISDLAESLLQRAFGLLVRDRLESPVGFAVVALGKLGGRELNFSSDVDLLFLYADDAPSDRMIRFARDYTRALAEYTSDGHLFRVDLRLRPSGRTGEIAYSEEACRQYYQTWADTMDRLALVKCRWVAGDRYLGERFVDSIQDFVFKKYLDYAALEEMRWTKKRTDDLLRRKRQTDTHVKLGLGGIREIEFFVQSFQILYGGTCEALRTPSTLTALDRLLDFGFIGQAEFEALRSAYVFLRDLEHKLQLVHDLQTHSLPDSEEELIRCARRMGYRGQVGPQEDSDSEILSKFQKDLKTNTLSVHKIFDSLFRNSMDERGIGEIVLNPSLSDEEALERLRGRETRQAEPVLEGIRLLAAAPAFPHSPSRIRNLLANLLPTLVGRASLLEDPRELFSRLDRFCDALQARAPLYAEMNENPDFAGRLLTLLSLGESYAETLIRSPELVDLVARPEEPADPRALLPLFLREHVSAGMSQREALRVFKRRKEFKIALRELDDPGSEATRCRLSELAEACLTVAWNTGFEACPQLREEPCALVALGKLGGGELAFQSDLDLVFLVDDTRTRAPLGDFYDFLKLFRDELTEYTAGGRAYELDLRLRPEGKHAGEVVPYSQFLKYFVERLEPWERLAWVKARILLSRSFTPDHESLIFERPFTDEEVASLRHVRLRKEREIGQEEKSGEFDFKVGRGGLLDVQFVIQFLQIQHHIPESNLLASLEKLVTRERIGSTGAETLQGAFTFFMALESMLDLQGGPGRDRLSADPEANRLTASLLGFASGNEFIARYREITQGVRDIFEQILGPLAH